MKIYYDIVAGFCGFDCNQFKSVNRYHPANGWESYKAYRYIPNFATITDKQKCINYIRKAKKGLPCKKGVLVVTINYNESNIISMGDMLSNLIAKKPIFDNEGQETTHPLDDISAIGIGHFVGSPFYVGKDSSLWTGIEPTKEFPLEI